MSIKHHDSIVLICLELGLFRCRVDHVLELIDSNSHLVEFAFIEVLEILNVFVDLCVLRLSFLSHSFKCLNCLNVVVPELSLLMLKIRLHFTLLSCMTNNLFLESRSFEF